MALDPKIRRADALRARALQLGYPLLNRLLLNSDAVEFATRSIKPKTVTIPTRYGSRDALVFAPPEEVIAAELEQGRLPPVHVLFHGGAFILQYTKGEGNVARYLASERGCYVVMPDYRAAPQVTHPVAEHEGLDAYQWVRESGDVHGWDGDRVTVGGTSTGGYLTLTTALLAADAGIPQPLALSVEFAPVNLGLPSDARTSSKRFPVITPGLIDLVKRTYFVGTDLDSTLASPINHPRLEELPPTLIITAEYDALRGDSEHLAAKLTALGVKNELRVFSGVDHGFTARKPDAAQARIAIEAMGDHLAEAFSAAG